MPSLGRFQAFSLSKKSESILWELGIMVFVNILNSKKWKYHHSYFIIHTHKGRWIILIIIYFVIWMDPQVIRKWNHSTRFRFIKSKCWSNRYIVCSQGYIVHSRVKRFHVVMFTRKSMCSIVFIRKRTVLICHNSSGSAIKIQLNS